MTQPSNASDSAQALGVGSSGDFSEVSFPKLLLDLCRTRYSGALCLARGKTEKRIVFQQGAPVLSESNLATETLGLQLIDQGSISQADHTRVSSYMERKQCKEGVALLALELLEPKGLFLALKEQLRRRMLEAFAWSSGSYRLEAADDLKSEVQPLRSDPLALVREGLLNHWSPDRLLADLTGQIELFPHRTKSFDEAERRLGKAPEITSLLGRIDGTQTLGASIGSQFNSTEALVTVWILVTGQYVRFLDSALCPAGEANDEEDFGAEIEIEVVEHDRAPSASPAETGEIAAGVGSAEGAQSDAADSMRAEVLARLEEIADCGFYELLGIEEHANDGQIRKAYFSAAKRFHPDALTHLGLSDIKQQAAEVFARIAEANDVLRDPAKRADYDARSQNPDEPGVDTHALAQAETFYRKGEILVRMGDFRGALEYLEPAVDLWPDECEYQSALGWALYKQPKADIDRALVYLERAHELDPAQGVTLFRLGMVLRASGATERAAECLAQAKQLDPGAS
jgi:tetratricopeptide (TPR) repeat protein